MNAGDVATTVGVCAICEDRLGNGEPVEADLPYHVACLAAAIRESGR